MFDTPVLRQFLSDLVWVKSNVSPRPSTYEEKDGGKRRRKRQGIDGNKKDRGETRK